MNKNIIIGAVLVVILGTSLVLRDRISEFLNFGTGEPPAPEILKENSSEDEKPKAASDEPKNPVAETKPEAKKTPAYTGRDPREFRPIPEEVKLFTEEQKQQLQARIYEHASAVLADPEYFFGWIQLGILKKTIGDFEGARDAWEYAGIIQPNNSLSFANLGELYWRYIGDFSSAEKNLKISIDHKPEDVQTHVTLAELYHYSMKEKYDLADDVLLNGLKANPNNGTLMRRLAYLYEQRKEYGLAIQWWEKVLEISPDDQDVLDTINRLRNKLSS